jgi:hypothetical protein
MTTTTTKPAKKSTQKRLRAGGLDPLVLGYLRKHEADGPLTASAVAKGIKRSSGAVANCLARLGKDKKVRQAKKNLAPTQLSRTRRRDRSGPSADHD